ncbi:30S ribosomal protein S6 [Candidatus Woesebacteria bacterium RBG_16_36_11]|uniref:Small ribosomal subunit protein bS6 n=3 Tax=Candidatus Woeseibacteriota TaxID=1752722 RepID=A0A1F7XBT2_9BACT|nr:MAG: 30S ribosomal protein S6 [Candidatus Woesebacteria bacterium RBG_13_36_22]OGM12480.1 MAG: 30S ribosomal protein S6 [Candidatus Woesebacteria bacterium RBG_16_36_11]OGM17361.1 MAG: 30S ribosomal protein S6 [Candidatus Woesebacteria bacterium RBG_19FT_COMBO_37_29]
MSNYELTIIVDGKITAAKKNSIKDIVEKLVESFKGKIVKTDDWGKLELAYKLGKTDSGVYLFYELELENLNVKGLSDKLKVEDSILRYLLVEKSNGKKFK